MWYKGAFDLIACGNWDGEVFSGFEMMGFLFWVRQKSHVFLLVQELFLLLKWWIFFSCFEILILLVLHCCIYEMASNFVKEFMKHFQPCFYSISRFCNFIWSWGKLKNDSFALRSLIYQNSSELDDFFCSFLEHKNMLVSVVCLPP